jgi:hypothetical protein
MRIVANHHNNKALELKENGQMEKAIACYEKAIKADPKWSVPWFNLGLLYKRQRMWEESLNCNQRAAELDPDDEAAWWNLGIAATALNNWSEARRAWQTYGIEIEPGDGEIEMNFGFVPIRLNPDGGGEVVWCKRIDPARAIIQNVPLPKSGYRYGDLVLHDGAPNGYRKNSRDEEVPVFDGLQLLHPSEYGTFEVIISGVGPAEIEKLCDQALDCDQAAEDWAELRHLCRACSEGRPFDSEHTHESENDVIYRRVGFAAQSEARVSYILNGWLARNPQARVEEINCVLTPALIN